ncbi:MAG: AraC family transcriptional regulator [Muribaculaceae bacterium]|nr:AraC family transcriptional regulator [Muribaculaceae bacterium]
MYTLKQGWMAMIGEMPMENWDGKMYCLETDATLTSRTNETEGFMSAYTFTLVTQGWLTLIYNGMEITLHPDDLYIYSPGLSVSVVAISEDYRGICLLADEHMTLDTPGVHDLVRIAYQPIVQLHEPKVTLPHDTAQQLASKMREIITYLHSDHIYKSEVIRMLYAVFLLDLQNAQHKAITHCVTPQRIEEIFIGFIRLLPHHFSKHHDIGFYASALNITSVYLSRVVKQVSGHTVVGYINQMLIMEASFLLRTTTLTIAEIADRLHFADTPSFSKFFSRLKGISPRAYRR